MASSFIEQSARTDNKQRIFGAVAVALVGLLSMSYFMAATEIAVARPLWMDEVLSVWAARLPTVAAIWDALEKGAEFSPPLYLLLLQKIIQLGGGGAFMLRLPSIVAVYVVGIAAYTLVRRRYPAPIAALALALCLTGGLYPFALQARPYACVVACFALALVIWDIPSDRPPSWRGAAAIFALLTIAIGMHFYAVLLAAAVGLMEFLWAAAHRHIRWPHMAAIALACLSILVWLPIMQHAAAFNHADSAATDYYGRPDAMRLALACVYLLVGHRPMWLSPILLLAPAAVGGILILLRWGGSRTTPPSTMDNLNIITGVTCALPLLIFLFSLEVTHTFNPRYIIAASFGLSILISRPVANLPWAAAAACLFVAVAVGVSLGAATPLGSAKSPDRALALVDQAPPNLPVVTGNGMRFFEIRENADAAVADRLVYLKSPAASANRDPTNEHQIERWKAINPQLAVRDMGEFIKAHSKFLLFSDDSAVDSLPNLLAGQGYRLRVIARAGDAYLAEIRTGILSEPDGPNVRQDAAVLTSSFGP